MDIENNIKDFLHNVDAKKIYNEISLQLELGIYLRNLYKKCGYKVEFERNVRFFGGKTFKFTSNSNASPDKAEIDIVIYKIVNGKKSDLTAIELKYPKNGQYPEEMYSFCRDISFMEKVKDQLDFDNTYCLTLVDDEKFYSGNCPTNIYKCFRTPSGSPNNPFQNIKGQIYKPTGKGKNILYVNIKGKYSITWIGLSSFSKSAKYYLISL